MNRVLVCIVAISMPVFLLSPYIFAQDEPCGKCEQGQPRPSGLDSPEVRQFPNPTFKGYRVDICLYWGRECEEPAATAWCKYQGYTRATAWEIDSNIGADSPTWILYDETSCDQPYCDGFLVITCSRP